MGDEDFKKKINEIREVFNLFDKESDGTININELTSICKCLNKSEDSEEEIKKLLKHIDTDQNEKIDFEEFFLAMYSKDEIKMNRTEIENAFKTFDKNNTGKVSCSELKFVFENLVGTLDENEINEIIKAYELESKDEIEYNQLIDEYFMEENNPENK